MPDNSQSKIGPTFDWLFRMAWRDSRRSRRRLLLFSMSIVLGIAAMVAIGSFGRSMELAAESQAKGLLGADLQIQSREDFTEAQLEFMNSLEGDHSDQILLSSMVLFPKTGGTRLAQVRALDGDFPFYGDIETTPVSGFEEYKNSGGALVEESFLHQYDAVVGDTIKVGELSLPIVGALLKVPGDNEFFANIAPRVYLRMEQMAATELVGDTTLARFRRYHRFDTDAQLNAAVKEMGDRREELQLRFDTVRERQEELGEALQNLYRFLNLVGFVALLLGSIGIASAVQVHIRQRLDSVAILRCLGATSTQAFLIYLIQGCALGVIGVATGTVIGLLVQQALPSLFAEYFPVDVAMSIHWWAVIKGATVGFAICVLFTLLPLLQVRNVSPLSVFRRALEPAKSRDKWVYILYAVLAVAVTAFSISQSDEWQHGVGFAGGLTGALLILAGVAKLVIVTVRKLNFSSSPFTWRQGLASLHRPNNRTVLLMVSLGLGTFLILTLHLIHHGLLAELSPAKNANRPNAILFDVQPDQKDGVLEILENQNLPILEVSPVITMRIQSVKGQTADEIRNTQGRRPRGWALRREYRSTFRDYLTTSEQLTSGEWIATASIDDEIIPVSLEEGIANDLNVSIGDEIVFDVQGIPVATQVASIRKVDWKTVSSNFFVVFPTGVLEDAPGFYIITSRIADAQESATMQRAVVEKYPNVSSIDLALILKVVDSVVSKISLGIRFMALFTVFTGVILLITAVLNSRFQRTQESILLRTLGASGRQIMTIQFVEFSLLGILASLTGILLAVGASWTLAHFVFKVAFTLPILHLLIAVALNSALTIGVGLFMSRGILNSPPLEVLRAE